MTDNSKASSTSSSGFITYPNRRYERYEKRIHRLYQIIAFIRRHIIAICSGIAALTIAVLSFLFCIGMFIGEVSCEDFTYGDPPSFSSQAFLTDTSYQYAKNTENLQWSDVLPTEPGEYRIRAVSQNPFGMFRYSKEAVFLLLPRTLTLEIRANACVYGDLTDDYLYKNTKITGLAKGDTIKDIQYEYATDPDKWDWVNVSIRSFRVVNDDGVDVTTSYDISTKGSSVALSLREITVNLDDMDKIYDGTTLIEIPLRITQNTLAEGDSIEVSFPEFPAVVGEYPITINSYKITNPAGEDVTHKYRIQFKYGSLQILPRPLVLETGSAQKQFDQTPLTNPGWSLLEGTVADGHSMITQLSDSPTYVGEYTNELLVQITDAEGTDVTSNYSITIRTGILKITPIILNIKTDSAEKIYDGKELVADGYELIRGEILPAHKLICEVVGMQLDAGQSNNELHIEILDSDNRNLIDLGYQLEIECGTLTVKPRPITIITESKEKVFDGKPLTHKVMKLTEGTLANGQSIQSTFINSQTYVGECPNALQVNIIAGSGTDVTSNYDITLQLGVLKVTPIILKFKTDSAEKVYDGKPLVAKGYELIQGKVLPSHQLICATIGVQLDVGQSENELYIEILDASGRNLVDLGYQVEIKCGTLTVTPRIITVTSESKEKLYDSTPLRHHVMKLTDGTLASGQSIEPAFTGSQTKVGESPNTFSVKIFTDTKEDVTPNYDISYVFGTLTVLPNEDYVPKTDDNGSGGGNGSDPGEVLSNSTQIDYPPPENSPTRVAKIKITGSSAYSYFTYLRASSYGDYTGSGFAAPPAYTDRINNTYISSIDFVGRNASAEKVPFSNMEITRYDSCPVLIPYYSYSTQTYFNASDTQFDSSLMKYSYQFLQLPDLYTAMCLSTDPSIREHELAYRSFAHENYLGIPDATRDDLLRIAANNGISATEDKYQLIVRIQNYIRTAATYNPNGNSYPQDVDVVVYFLEVAKEGICQHFAAAATMMYRAFGIPARYVVGYVTNADPNQTVYIQSDQAHAWVEIYLDGIGWIPVEVTGSANPIANGKREVVVASYSASKIYDGKPFDTWTGDLFNIIKGQLLPGHTIKVTVTESNLNAINVGSYINRITSVTIYDENGIDVTDELYSIQLEHGQKEIRQRTIAIQIGSAHKLYDGLPLICNNWWIISGNLLPNHKLSVTITKSITGIGVAANTASSVRVYSYDSRGNELDCTKNYEVIVLPGELAVYKE